MGASWSLGEVGVPISAMECALALVAIPETDQMTLPLGLRCIRERRTAVGEVEVVEILDLAALDGELDPQLGVGQNLLHGGDRVDPFRIKGRSGEPGARLDQRLVAARDQAARVVFEHGLPADLLVVRRVLGLAIPRERTVETRQELRMAPAEGVVSGHEADETAHPAFLRRMQAEQTDELWRLSEPRRVGVEEQLEIGERAA